MTYHPIGVVAGHRVQAAARNISVESFWEQGRLLEGFIHEVRLGEELHATKVIQDMHQAGLVTDWTSYTDWMDQTSLFFRSEDGAIWAKLKYAELLASAPLFDDGDDCSIFKI